MDKLSQSAFRAYRKLVYETPGFTEYFFSATPIAEIAEMNIGSRPASRKSTRKIEDLRVRRPQMQNDAYLSALQDLDALVLAVPHASYLTDVPAMLRRLRYRFAAKDHKLVMYTIRAQNGANRH